MTLEELKNKKVTITLNKTINLEEDLGYKLLKGRILDQEYNKYDDETLIKELIDDFYSSWNDISDIIDSNEFKVTIHD